MKGNQKESSHGWFEKHPHDGLQDLWDPTKMCLSCCFPFFANRSIPYFETYQEKTWPPLLREQGYQFRRLNPWGAAKNHSAKYTNVNLKSTSLVSSQVPLVGQGGVDGVEGCPRFHGPPQHQPRPPIPRHGVSQFPGLRGNHLAKGWLQGASATC